MLCSDEKCLNCSFEYGICERCEDGYGLDGGGECVQCPYGCQKCSYVASLNRLRCNFCFWAMVKINLAYAESVGLKIVLFAPM